MLDRVVCSCEQYSFQMCLESGDGSETFCNWRRRVPDSNLNDNRQPEMAIWSPQSISIYSTRNRNLQMGKIRKMDLKSVWTLPISRRSRLESEAETVLGLTTVACRWGQLGRMAASWLWTLQMNCDATQRYATQRPDGQQRRTTNDVEQCYIFGNPRPDHINETRIYAALCRRMYFSARAGKWLPKN